MYSPRKTLWTIFFLMPLLVVSSVYAGTADDYADDEVPDVTERVARISLIEGEAQIRRADSEDWEVVTKNLPVVEGDEIATDDRTRLEIQFDSRSYLRVSEKAYLKITTLRDEGVAISLSQGSGVVRVFEFDKEEGYFEIDAPGTTIAVQSAGMYRVDAGDENYKVVHIVVTEGGEARVYSINAGFLLRDGRSARVFTEGQYAGDWDLDDASRNMDQFDNWSIERDELITERLADAFYDKYYDRDIYGAEDLNEYGEWISTADYGNVWRPYRNTTSQFSDWSPYRYGQWRWLPSYGWTWVNDEPWGWATYHYGRWVFYSGYWVWTPYGRYRSGRSWWRPALVVVATVGRNICWYPLPYYYSYYDYNRHWRRNRGRRHRDRNDDNGGNGNPTATPTPSQTPHPLNVERARRLQNPRAYGYPANGVITVDAGQFGRGGRGFRPAPADVATDVLSKIPDVNQTPPILPSFEDLDKKVSPDILIRNPKFEESKPIARTGATDRTGAAPLDEKLRQQRVYGNRTPITASGEAGKKSEPPDAGSTEKRDTGAVKRPPTPIIQTDDTPPVRTAPRRTYPAETVERKPDPPVTTTPRRNNPPRESPPYVPPTRKEEPRYDPPPRREEPKYEPPPRSDPPPKNDPPPQKNEPKSDPPPEKKGKP